MSVPILTLRLGSCVSEAMLSTAECMGDETTSRESGLGISQEKEREKGGVK